MSLCNPTEAENNPQGVKSTLKDLRHGYQPQRHTKPNKFHLVFQVFADLNTTSKNNHVTVRKNEKSCLGDRDVFPRKLKAAIVPAWRRKFLHEIPNIPT